MTQNQEKLKKYICETIANKFVYDEPCFEIDDYYKIFMKYGERILSYRNTNLIAFLADHEQYGRCIVIILGIPLNEKNSSTTVTKRFGEKIIKIINDFETVTGSCDSVYLSDKEQYVYLHIVKVLSYDVLNKLSIQQPKNQEEEKDG